MIDPVPIDERRPPITPQLALRVAVLGGIAFVLFAIIFFRLWYLQVLSGDQYLQQARDNRVRELRVQAPRGDIVDRNGHVLVENRAATVVQIDPESLPAAERNAAATWGQHVTARSRRPKGKKGPLVADPAAGHAAPRDPLQEPRARAEHVAQDDPGARRAVPGVAALRQRDGQGRRRRPAPQLPRRAPRGLPRHRRRAQVPAPLPAALAGGPARRAASARSTTPSSSSSASRASRRGRWSARAASSAPTTSTCAASTARPRSPSTRSGGPRARPPGHDPVPGRSVRTTLDLGLQQTGEKYLDQTINQGPGTAGGFVALDPRDGSVLALGSYPDGQPVDPLQAVLAGHRRSALRRQRRRAAVQPRDRRLLSDGLDLQADHGAGGHEHAASCSPATSSTTTAASRSAPRARRRATPARRRSAR